VSDAGEAAGLIDRLTQNLPVPLGGVAPVRVVRRRRRRVLRRCAPAVASAVGLAAACAGGVMVVAPHTYAATLVGHQVEIGGMALLEVGPLPGGQGVLYSGAASFVLSRHADGSARAAASWTSHGSTSSGVCHVIAPGRTLIDECTFHVAEGTLTSVDVLDPASGDVWQRTYGDGVRVSIAVSTAGMAIPVPFPMGH
jgi:hypothetical protein